MIEVPRGLVNVIQHSGGGGDFINKFSGLFPATNTLNITSVACLACAY